MALRPAAASHRRGHGHRRARLARTSEWSPPTVSWPRTRPSSGGTRSGTRPASTRTACSRTARHTRSWTRPRSASISNSIVLGKHSGRHALQDALQQLGLQGRGRRAEPGVQALQGDRGQEEAVDGARPGGDRLRRDARLGAGLQPRLVRGRGRLGSGRPRRASAVVPCRVGRSRSRRPPATAPSMRSSARFARRPEPTPIFSAPRDRGRSRAAPTRWGQVSVSVRANGKLASGQGVATDILEAAARAFVRAISNALEGVAIREAEEATADAISGAHAGPVVGPALPRRREPAQLARRARRRTPPFWWLWERFTDVHATAYKASHGRIGGTYGKRRSRWSSRSGARAGKRRTHPAASSQRARDGDEHRDRGLEGRCPQAPGLVPQPDGESRETTVNWYGKVRRMRAREVDGSGTRSPLEADDRRVSDLRELPAPHRTGQIPVLVLATCLARALG